MAKKDRAAETAETLDGLDALLQHRSRLGALVLLADVDALTFPRLRELLSETDGNLGAHLRKLEEAGYLSVRKEFIERKPASWYALTQRGLDALKRHLTALDRMVRTLNGRAAS